MAFGFTVNHENVFGKGIEEAGRYNVQITRAEKHKSPASGNEYITIDYEVLDGKYKGGQIRYQNMTWDDNDEVMSEKRFNTLAVALGGEDGTNFNDIQLFAQQLVNMKLTVDVDWGKPDKNGKVYLAVMGYHRLLNEPSQPNGVRRPETTNAQQPVNAGAPSFGGNGQSQPSTASPFSNTGAPKVSDDDLPF